MQHQTMSTLEHNRMSISLLECMTMAMTKETAMAIVIVIVMTMNQ